MALKMKCPTFLCEMTKEINSCMKFVVLNDHSDERVKTKLGDLSQTDGWIVQDTSDPDCHVGM